MFDNNDTVGSGRNERGSVGEGGQQFSKCRKTIVLVQYTAVYLIFGGEELTLHVKRLISINHCQLWYNNNSSYVK